MLHTITNSKIGKRFSPYREIELGQSSVIHFLSTSSIMKDTHYRKVSFGRGEKALRKGLKLLPII
uniref:Uncharacterized protein n=1 Tax=Rhizophora mucronata TaxID=61149 RepID=A0A2P2J506_RHIMU